MGRLFGTDGIRGKANVPPMTADMALAVGRAVARVCRRSDKSRIVVGRDTRASGDMIEAALCAGICSMGVDAGTLGIIPTPGVAFAVRHTQADAGIVISASHNPFEDNGIKVFGPSGQKPDDAMEARIEALVTADAGKDAQMPPRVGRIEPLPDLLRDYGIFCRSTVPADMSFGRLKIVLDCANGAAFQVAPEVFRGMGASVLTINDQPDGTNINQNCGSQHTERLIRAVRECRADAGLAFDGDADRLIAVDDAGRELDGDAILAVCAVDLRARNILRNHTVVATPMSNLGLRLVFQEMGIRLMDAAVGDRHVLELMNKTGACLGGEQSGHVIFLDRHSTGDGIISGLQLLAATVRSGRRLSELANIFKPAPQRLVNVEVRDKPDLQSIPGLAIAIKAASDELGNRGRVLVRYSGTQMLCRVMVEAPDATTANKLAESIASVLQATLA